MAYRKSREHILVLSILFVVPWLILSCGDGWDAYKDAYNTDQGEPPGKPWVGDETVYVVLDATEIETPLEGIVTSDSQGIGAVRLSDLIEASRITSDPDVFRYDFTATDGYNLLAKRGGDLSLLPNRSSFGLPLNSRYIYTSSRKYEEKGLAPLQVVSELPARGVWDIHLAQKFPFRGDPNKYVEAFVDINNVLDTYYEEDPFKAAPGRMVWAGIRGEF